MKKRLLSFFLAAVLAASALISLLGCGRENSDSSASEEMSSGAASDTDSSSASGTDSYAESSSDASASSGPEASEASGSGSADEEESCEEVTLTCRVSLNEEFGHVNFDADSDDFKAAGFEYGDSCTLSFTNGQKFQDVPFYSGYYGKTGELIIVDYPGIAHVLAAYCNGNSLWEELGLCDRDAVTVTLEERGKYLADQEALCVSYSNDQEDQSDEVFANFRPISGGSILPDTFYRGASPADNKFNRASDADGLISRAGIAFILDLADTDEKIAGYEGEADFNSPYFAALYAAGRVCPLGMNMNFLSTDFAGALVSGLRELMANDGPYYIHCTEGKDRTGIVCCILECIAGFSREEMEADYMKTYENYYGITYESDPDKYEAIVNQKFLDVLCGICGVRDASELQGIDYAEAAHWYLAAGGLTDEEYEQLKVTLCGAA